MPVEKLRCPGATGWSTRIQPGVPPGEWLQRERLRLAQRLLESTDEPIERVARRAGYESSVTMRAQFATRVRTSPRAHRRTFRAQRRGR
jgi:transcriptional regulator GlxA family with amidase domain